MARRWPRIEITDADIAEAGANYRERSPFTIAARRQFSRSDVRVSSYDLTFIHHCEQCCCSMTFRGSRRARRFLHRFSRGLSVQPGRFEFRGPTTQALLSQCSCDASKMAQQRTAAILVEIRRMARLVGTLRAPYQRLSEEPQLSAVRTAFPFLAHQSQRPHGVETAK